MKVLALIDDANVVCCWYRIEVFEQAMAREDMSLEIVRFDTGILRRIGNLHKAKRADAVILQRKLLPLWQTSLLRRWARRLIFDVDDAIFQRDSNSGKGPGSKLQCRSCGYPGCKLSMVQKWPGCEWCDECGSKHRVCECQCCRQL